MSFNSWRPSSRRQNLIKTITVASNTDTQTFLITLKHPSGSPASAAVTIASDTASSDTTATIAAELYAQLIASEHEWAKQVTWSYPGSGAVITATANVAGIPFVMSTSGTGTLTVAVVDQNVGPEDWDTPGNWTLGVKPVTGDDVYLSGRGSILYGLDQQSVDIDSMTITDFIGDIGYQNLYLSLEFSGYLMVDAKGCNLSLRPVNAGPTVSSIIAINTFYAFCTADFTLLSMLSGKLIASGPFVSTTLQIDEATVQLSGPDIAVTTVRMNGGEFLMNSDAGIVTLTIDAGNARIEGACAITTATLSSASASLTHNGGTITTANLYAGLLDMAQSKKARTITTLNHHQAGRLRYDKATITITTDTPLGVMERAGAR